MLVSCSFGSDALEMKPPAKRFKIGSTSSSDGSLKFHSIESRARTGEHLVWKK